MKELITGGLGSGRTPSDPQSAGVSQPPTPPPRILLRYPCVGHRTQIRRVFIFQVLVPVGRP